MFTRKKAVVSVINDLVTDARVLRSCAVLRDCGYDVKLIGRVLPGSPPVPQWPVETHRMRMLFRSGPLFYLFFNVRLFFYLLFSEADLLFANDLDTLWPNRTVARFKRIPMIYDSHELFCEVPELTNSPLKKRIWELLESSTVPKLKYCITVNESIAAIFAKRYGVKFHVIRNIPDDTSAELKTREELGLPVNKKIILLQGAGINIQRGAEELVLAMKYIEDALLLIIGSGDVWKVLETSVRENGLQERVRMIKRIPKQELLSYTAVSDIGVSIDKDTNLNYRNSLPNKIFDYFRCGIPVLSTHLPEIEKLVEHYDCGWFIENHQPEHIADRLKKALLSEGYARKKENAFRAGKELNWEKEREKYLTIIKSIETNP